MAAVTSAMVKELRERTSAGMMDCKKALVASDGDMDSDTGYITFSHFKVTRAFLQGTIHSTNLAS